MIEIRRGFDVPFGQGPAARFSEALVSRVGVSFLDYQGFRPTLKVNIGDQVSRGSALACQRGFETLSVVSPISGVVRAINRAQERRLMSIEIERDGTQSAVSFPKFSEEGIPSMDPKWALDWLGSTGILSAVRVRPFGRVPAKDQLPQAIFVNAVSTDPLGVFMPLVLEGRAEDLKLGLTLLSRIAPGAPIFYCCPSFEHHLLPPSVTPVAFSGKYPASLSGTHIHHLYPVTSMHDVRWSIGVQEVLAIGYALRTGEIEGERVVALSGPAVLKEESAHVRAPQGAFVADLLKGRLDPSLFSVRQVAGSLLYGRAVIDGARGLGPFHTQASALSDEPRRPVFGWLSPGFKKFSALPIYVSSILRPRAFEFDARQNGSTRALIHMAHHQKALGVNLEAAPLLRALAVGDLEAAVNAGVLELLEEDLALCTFVDHSKHDFGYLLREALDRIYHEYFESHH